jgi:hypothetical protein
VEFCPAHNRRVWLRWDGKLGDSRCSGCIAEAAKALARYPDTERVVVALLRRGATEARP